MYLLNVHCFCYYSSGCTGCTIQSYCFINVLNDPNDNHSRFKLIPTSNHDRNFQYNYDIIPFLSVNVVEHFSGVAKHMIIGRMKLDPLTTLIES